MKSEHICFSIYYISYCKIWFLYNFPIFLPPHAARNVYTYMRWWCEHPRVKLIKVFFSRSSYICLLIYFRVCLLAESRHVFYGYRVCLCVCNFFGSHTFTIWARVSITVCSCICVCSVGETWQFKYCYGAQQYGGQFVIFRCSFFCLFTFFLIHYIFVSPFFNW